LLVSSASVFEYSSALFDSTRLTISERVLLPLRARVLVLPAKLQNEAGIKGASSLVFYNN